MNRRWQLAQAMEIRWWRKYLKKKNPDEYRQEKINYWRRVLGELAIKVPVGASVLDAGCGPAGIFLDLAHCQVKAIDPLLDQYSSLPHFKPTDYPWVQFEQQKLEDLGEIGHYNFIFCLNVINHVDDLILSLQNLYDACLPGATLVLSVDAHNFQLFRHVFSWIPGDVLHPHQYFLHEYLDKMKAVGFQILETKLLKEQFFFNYYGVVARAKR